MKDIYILEHRHCGAYRSFFKDGLGNYEKRGEPLEFEHHKKYALRLTRLLINYLDKRQKALLASNDPLHSKYRDEIRIHSFLMDLRGDVELLYTTAAVTSQEE